MRDLAILEYTEEMGLGVRDLAALEHTEYTEEAGL